MKRRHWHDGAGWLVAVILALVTACTGSLESSDSGDSRSGQKSDVSSKQQVTDIVDEFIEDDYTGVYDDVRALLVLVGARPLAERYYDSSAKATSDVASVTKSVMSILVGIALDEGELRDVDQSLGELLPDYAKSMAPNVAGVTLRQVLTMTAGLPADGPSNETPYTSAKDWLAAIVSEGLEQPPGEGFAYSSAGSHLLSGVLVEATGRSVLDYAREKLFNPLGISTEPAAEPLAVVENLPAYDAASFAWPVDPQRHHTGGSGLKISARDMSRLGRLMLAGGRWGGKRIVSSQWVTESTRAQVASNGATVDYGFQWWITTADGHDAFAASGFGGQLIEVVPDLDLVVVVSSTIPDYPRLSSSPFLSLVDQLIAPALGS
jgi:CubicO group peptidase (beta-lactamase class C family)